MAGGPAYAGSCSGSPKRPKKSTKRSGIIGSSGQRLYASRVGGLGRARDERRHVADPAVANGQDVEREGQVRLSLLVPAVEGKRGLAVGVDQDVAPTPVAG